MFRKNSFILNALLAAALLFTSTTGLHAQTGKPQAGDLPQQTVQSVVAKQAALVSEFDVNGMKVLLKRREGSLTVAAGLFKRRYRIADALGFNRGYDWLSA
jgi:hypothetical protein